MRLSSKELQRYARQIILPQIGEKGQLALKQTKIFIAGIGGLGSFAAYYLASAGIGTIKIVDNDIVSLENLNRQIIHHTSDIGRSKTESAREKIEALNPNCQVERAESEIRIENAFDLVEDCDMILDATDNFRARIALNRVSLQKRIPFIHGGINGFNGMATTFIPGETPCLECLFNDRPSSESKIGVVSPLPGLVASIQSMEAIKIALGYPPCLKGKLLYIYGFDMSFKSIQIEKDGNCKICGNL